MYQAFTISPFLHSVNLYQDYIHQQASHHRQAVLSSCRSADFVFETGGISSRAACRPGHTVARNDDGNRVMPDSSSDSLCRHSFHSALMRKSGSNLSVSHCLPIRNRQKYLQDPFAECGSAQGDCRHEVWDFSAEVDSKPSAGLIKYRE